MKKRILSFLVAAIMIMSLLPSVVLAADGGVAQIGTTTYTTLANALEAAETMEGDVVITLLADATWTIGAESGSTPLIKEGAKVASVTIDGQNKYNLTADGNGVAPIRAANDALLTFKNMEIIDESVSYNENAWELTYLEFAGNLAFENCTFNKAIQLAERNIPTSAVFTNCSFNSNVDTEYAVWVGQGTVEFNDCTFTGPRGLKIHEAYGSEVTVVSVEDCLFTDITEKAGIEIGDVNQNTTVEITGSKFVNCPNGDYKSDTEVENFGLVVVAAEPVAKIGEKTYTTLAKALKAAEAMEGDVVITLLADATWTTGGSPESTPLIKEDATVDSVTIDGQGMYTLTADGNGLGAIRAANDALLTFKNMEIIDESHSYNENAWELTYLEFAGNLAFENCTFNKAIQLAERNIPTSAVFTNCSFNSNVDTEYAVWVGQGTVEFKDCTFTGPRGLKIHEAYTTDVEKVVVQDCLFTGITEKAGIEIGDVNQDTTVEITGSEFVNCPNGIYNSDTNTTTFDFRIQNHVAADVWSKDSEYHWHGCVEPNCNYVSDKEQHTFTGWVRKGDVMTRYCEYCEWTETCDLTPSEKSKDTFYNTIKYLSTRKYSVIIENDEGAVVTDKTSKNLVLLSVDGASAYRYLADVKYTIAAADGYEITAVYLDGKPVDNFNGNLTVRQIKKDHVITVVTEAVAVEEDAAIAEDAE